MSETVIALDAMSGDHGPEVVISAAFSMVKNYPDLKLILVGEQDTLQALVTKNKRYRSELNERITIQHASQVVTMEEPPAMVLRTKKDSSMRVAIELVKNNVAHACVSAGNTGALMATARFVLKMIPGIDRPAICSALPATQGHTHMMDLGANLDSTSEHLYQFALMGTELVTAIDNNPSPRVGLLNIGQEESKGSDKIKQASLLISKSKLNYIGYVEGYDIYTDRVDVVICDGFTGNISLKSSEGVAKMLISFLKQEFQRNIFTKLLAFISLPILREFKRRVDPRSYNGASLLGLQGIVVKSHGSADRIAFANAIKIAMLEVKNNVVLHISNQLN